MTSVKSPYIMCLTADTLWFIITLLATEVTLYYPAFIHLLLYAKDASGDSKIR